MAVEVALSLITKIMSRRCRQVSIPKLSGNLSCMVSEVRHLETGGNNREIEMLSRAASRAKIVPLDIC
jgi:hypothetical protein